MGFNPRPCVRGDVSLHRLYRFVKGFNPRPCVRGDVVVSYTSGQSGVSIHAPA